MGRIFGITGWQLAVVAVLSALIVVAGAGVLYTFVGWSRFSFAQGGGTPSWAPASGRKVSSLRFQNCTFKLTPGAGGGVITKNVTATLNGMAAAYGGKAPYASHSAPAVLELIGPLDALSFTIKGVNDATTLGSPAKAAAWRSRYKATLTGKWRTL